MNGVSGWPRLSSARCIRGRITLHAVLVLAYLATFGSLAACTAYVWLLSRMTAS